MLRLLLLIFISTHFFLNTYAQQNEYVFSSDKILLSRFGELKETSTPSQSIIILNFRDSVIQFEPGSSDISDFLNYQSSFPVSYSKGLDKAVQLYVSNEYIFVFDFNQRTLNISRKDNSPRTHFLLFRNIIKP
jgi:hypothetical protein